LVVGRKRYGVHGVVFITDGERSCGQLLAVADFRGNIAIMPPIAAQAADPFEGSPRYRQSVPPAGQRQNRRAAPVINIAILRNLLVRQGFGEESAIHACSASLAKS